MPWWQTLVTIVVAALAAAALGFLATDDDEDLYIDFWAPDRLRWTRISLGIVHAAVGLLGAGAAVSLGWVPATSTPWWLLNGFVYASAAVALFRSDVAGFRLGSATATRSLLSLVERRLRRDLNAGIHRNIGALMHSATDERLVATAFEVLERVYNPGNARQVGHRELTDDIESAAQIFDSQQLAGGQPGPDQVRAWVREFIVHELTRNQLVLRGHRTWTDAQHIWAQD